jgi:hypothetical protein
MNFQLSAVLLSLGTYAFIESGTFPKKTAITGQFYSTITTVCCSKVNFMLPCYLVFNWFAVLRMKLSKRLDACVLDRPCSQSGCGHRHKSQEWWVVLVNTGFVLLNLFHLAYLGVMFDVTNEEPGLQEQVRITMSDRAATYELYYACM